MLWLYLTEAHPELLEERPLRFLHFAPEESFTRLLRSRPNVEYVSADLDSPLAEQKADIQALPFPDESFDALLCSHVLEHVEDDRRAMGELHRVLRPGGWGIVMVPQHGGLAETLEDPSVDTPQERLETYGQADHLRLYGRDFQDRLRAAGFDVEVTEYAQELPSELRTRYVLGPDRIHLCRRT